MNKFFFALNRLHDENLPMFIVCFVPLILLAFVLFIASMGIIGYSIMCIMPAIWFHPVISFFVLILTCVASIFYIIWRDKKKANHD